MRKSQLNDADVERLLRETFAATVVPSQAEEGLPTRDRLDRVALSSRSRWRWAGPLAVAAVVVLVAGGIFAHQRAGSNHPASGSGPDGVGVSSAPGPVATVGPDPEASGSPASRAKQEEIYRRIHVVSAKIEAIAVAHDPEFDLIASDLDGQGHYVSGLTVYRADPNPGRRAHLYAPVIPSDVKVTYARALLSSAQQGQISSLVASRRPALQQMGIHVTTWGGEDVPGGRYVIQYDPDFTKPGDQARKEFEIFGAGTVVFQPGKVAF